MDKINLPFTSLSKVSLFLYILVFLAGTGFILHYSLNKVEESQRVETIRSLKTTINIIDKAINIYSKHKIDESRIYARNKVIYRETQKLLKLKNAPQQILKSEHLKNLRTYLRPILKAQRDQNFYIISKDFINIASLKDKDIGKTNALYKQDENQFIKAFDGQISFTSPLVRKNKFSMLVLAPILNMDGQALALLAIEFDPSYILIPMSKIGHFGETGKTYLINRKGQLISQGDHNRSLIEINSKQNKTTKEPMQILDTEVNLVQRSTLEKPQQKINLTKAAEYLIQGYNKFSTESYIDLRGTPVLGVWHWSEQLDLGIISEINEKEVLKLTRTHGNIVRNIFIFMSLFSIALSVIIHIIRKKAVEKLELEKEKVDRANQIKDKMLSLVGHDLRGPITNIINFCEIFLLEHTADSPDNKVIQRINIIARKALSLLDTAFKIGRRNIGSLIVEKKWVKLNKIFSDILPEHTVYAEQKGITLKAQVDEKAVIFMDPILMSEVFSNLISNSIKFCKAGDTISIQASAQHPDFIFISDTGLGMDKEKVTSIFSYGGNNSTLGTAGEKGTGLGLPLCHDIISAHEGKIEVSSELGKGTKISIYLPPEKKD